MMEDILVIDSTGNIDLYTEPISDNAVSPVQEQEFVPDPTEQQAVVIEEVEEVEEKEEVEEVEELQEKSDIEEIKEILRGLNENENNDNDEFDDVLDSVSDNVVSISSNNIITTQIKDYTISESLLLLLFVSVLIGGMVYLIHKSIFSFR